MKIRLTKEYNLYLVYIEKIENSTYWNAPYVQNRLVLEKMNSTKTPTPTPTLTRTRNQKRHFRARKARQEAQQEAEIAQKAQQEAENVQKVLSYLTTKVKYLENDLYTFSPKDKDIYILNEHDFPYAYSLYCEFLKKVANPQSPYYLEIAKTIADPSATLFDIIMKCHDPSSETLQSSPEQYNCNLYLCLFCMIHEAIQHISDDDKYLECMLDIIEGAITALHYAYRLKTEYSKSEPRGLVFAEHSAGLSCAIQNNAEFLAIALNYRSQSVLVSDSDSISDVEAKFFEVFGKGNGIEYSPILCGVLFDYIKFLCEKLNLKFVF